MIKFMMKNAVIVLALGLATVLISGCGVKDFSRTVEQTVKGDYYLRSDKSAQGRSSFQREVQENPDSALANYYYGRFLLQEKENKLALKHLKKARDLEKENADYQFWTGLAFGANGKIEEEEKCYRNALKIDKNHLQALIYLGHLCLRKKKYQESLDLYSQALEIWPGSPSASYNRALILNRLGRTPEEQEAWLYYLNGHPSGSMAEQAADYLNLTRDYSFRNHRLGNDNVTIEKIRFIPFTADLDDSSLDSLHLVGEVFSGIKKGTLQVVVYQKGNKELAHQRALSIKKFLLSEFPSIPSKKIGVSWFSESLNAVIRGKKLTMDDAVSFFVSVK